MPISHAEAIKSTPGVQDVTWANWFGGIYKDPQNFFAQFAIEPESYLRMYPEILLSPRRSARSSTTAPAASSATAWRNYGFKVGDKITLQVGIPTYGTRDFDFTVRGIYKVGRRGRRQPVDVLPLEVRRRAIRAEGARRVVYRADLQPGSGGAGGRRHRPEVRELAVRDQDRHGEGVSDLVRVDVRQPQPAARQHRAGGRDHDAVRRRQHDGDVGARADDGDRRDADARLPVGDHLSADRRRRAADGARRRPARGAAGPAARQSEFLSEPAASFRKSPSTTPTSRSASGSAPSSASSPVSFRRRWPRGSRSSMR